MATSGSNPPPMGEFSFLKVNDSTDIIFGGSSGDELQATILDNIFTLDHKKMVCL